MDQTLMHPSLFAPRRTSSTRTPARDILAALVLKGALLAALYMLCFDASHRSATDAATIAKALVGDAQSKDAP